MAFFVARGADYTLMVEKKDGRGSPKALRAIAAVGAPRLGTCRSSSTPIRVVALKSAVVGVDPRSASREGS